MNNDELKPTNDDAPGEPTLLETPRLTLPEIDPVFGLLIEETKRCQQA